MSDKIAIISDTHDNVKGIKEAIRIMKKENIKTLIHCGDVVAPKTIELFKDFHLILVHGNCDGDVLNNKKKIDEINGQYLGEFGIIKINNKNIAIYHGYNKFYLDVLKKNIGNGFDILCYGHTHKSEIKEKHSKENKYLIINPGSLYEEEKSFALLEPKTMIAEIVPIQV